MPEILWLREKSAHTQHAFESSLPYATSLCGVWWLNQPSGWTDTVSANGKKCPTCEAAALRKADGSCG